MVDKKLSMSDIAERIDSEFTNELHCIFSDDNAEKLILRVQPCPSLSATAPVMTLSTTSCCDHTSHAMFLCSQECLGISFVSAFHGAHQEARVLRAHLMLTPLLGCAAAHPDGGAGQG